MTTRSLRPSRRDTRLVLAFATSTRLLTCLALYLLPRILPAFDTSATLLLGPSHPFEGFLRWDGLHFVRLATAGRYETEKDYAFMPGIWLTMRWSGIAVAWIRGKGFGVENAVLGGIVLANLASIFAAVVLQRYAATLLLAFGEV